MPPAAVASVRASASPALASRTQERMRQAQRHEHLRGLMLERICKRVLGAHFSAAAGAAVTQLPTEVVRWARTELEASMARGDVSEGALVVIANGAKHHFPTLATAMSRGAGGGAMLTSSSLARGGAGTPTLLPPMPDMHEAHEATSPTKRRTAKATTSGGAPAPIDGDVRLFTTAPTAAVNAGATAWHGTTQLGRTGLEFPTFNGRAGPSGSPPASQSPAAALLDSVRRPLPSADEDLWAKLARAQAAEFHQDIVRQRTDAKAKHTEQQKMLEEQVALKRARAQQQRVEDRQYAAEEHRQIEALQQAERQRLAQERAAHEAERVRREQLLADTRDRKRREEAAETAREAAARKKLEEEHKHEQATRRAKEAALKAEYRKAISGNDELRQRRQERIEAEKALDGKLEQEYLDRLAREEQAREDALITMFAKQRKQLKVAERLATNLWEKSAEDEKRAKAYTAAAEARATDAERTKAQKAKEEDLKQRAFLQLQVDEKKRRHDAERAAELAERDEVTAAVHQQEALRRQQQIDEKVKQMRAKEALESQLADIATRRRVVMTDEEKRINAALLAKVGYRVAS